MRYLAVSGTAQRRSLVTLRHWGRPTPHWHAVAETIPEPLRTLCGSPYGSEAHRTWDQVISGSRCPQCERLVAAASNAKGATFIAEGATSGQAGQGP